MCKKYNESDRKCSDCCGWRVSLNGWVGFKPLSVHSWSAEVSLSHILWPEVVQMLSTKWKACELCYLKLLYPLKVNVNTIVWNNKIAELEKNREIKIKWGIWANQAVLALTFPNDWAETGRVNAETGGTLLNASHVTSDLISSLFQPFLRPNGLRV